MPCLKMPVQRVFFFVKSNGDRKTRRTYSIGDKRSYEQASSKGQVMVKVHSETMVNLLKAKRRMNLFSTRQRRNRFALCTTFTR